MVTFITLDSALSAFCFDVDAINAFVILTANGCTAPFAVQMSRENGDMAIQYPLWREWIQEVLDCRDVPDGRDLKALILAADETECADDAKFFEDLTMKATPDAPVEIDGWVPDPKGWGSHPDGLPWCLDVLGARAWMVTLAEKSGYRPNLNWARLLRLPDHLRVEEGDVDQESKDLLWDARFSANTGKVGLLIQELGLRVRKAEHTAATVTIPEPKPTKENSPKKGPPEAPKARKESKTSEQTSKAPPKPAEAPAAPPVKEDAVEAKPVQETPRAYPKVQPRYDLRVVRTRGQWGVLGHWPAFVGNALQVRALLNDTSDAGPGEDPQEILDGILDVAKTEYEKAAEIKKSGASRSERRFLTQLAEAGWEGEMPKALRTRLEKLIKGGKSMKEAVEEIQTTPVAELPFSAKPPEVRAEIIRQKREEAEIRKLVEEESAPKPVEAVPEVVETVVEVQAVPVEAEVQAVTEAAENVEEAMKILPETKHEDFQKRVASGESPMAVVEDILTAPEVVEGAKPVKKPRAKKAKAA